MTSKEQDTLIGEEEGSERNGSAGEDDPGKRGDTTLSTLVVQRIAGIAANEVQDVRFGGSGMGRTFGEWLEDTRSGGGRKETRGVKAEVGSIEAAIDLSLSIKYAASIPESANAIRSNVISRVESLTGLKVTEVNITVHSLFFDEGSDAAPQKQLTAGNGSQREPRVK